jgi:dipeptidyl aminopeptidase/acylaminoacyl peptidase
VASVDYRGSSGYGRAFRSALAGQWGVADVEDCTAYAEALAADGIVDGTRMAIRGSSAGGLTALAALAASDAFLGAVSWYGVTDLEALARDTHDFESRYLDGLVGPWPAAATLYRKRSPIHAAGRMSGSVLLLQGAEDPVVPATQSQEFAIELEAAGVDCQLIVFPGESHGFRRADTIATALEAELAFYERVFASDGVGEDAS